MSGVFCGSPGLLIHFPIYWGDYLRDCLLEFKGSLPLYSTSYAYTSTNKNHVCPHNRMHENSNCKLLPLQILILSRVTPQQFKKLQSTDKSVPLPDVNPDPLCSNVYSVGERIILAWINHHYEVQRQKPWPESMDGK